MGISPLPRRVEMGEFVGRVTDEVSIQRDFENTDCLFLIQLVRWNDDSETIRFAYYTKPHGSDESQWNYANRPPNIEPDVLRELISRARRRPWFSSVL